MWSCLILKAFIISWWRFIICDTFNLATSRCATFSMICCGMEVLIALAGEPHLAVDFLVLQHINNIIEQFSAVAADQDIRVTVSFEISQLWWYWLGCKFLCLVRGAILLVVWPTGTRTNSCAHGRDHAAASRWRIDRCQWRIDRSCSSCVHHGFGMDKTGEADSWYWRGLGGLAKRTVTCGCCCCRVDELDVMKWLLLSKKIFVSTRITHLEAANLFRRHEPIQWIQRRISLKTFIFDQHWKVSKEQ